MPDAYYVQLVPSDKTSNLQFYQDEMKLNIKLLTLLALVYCVFAEEYYQECVPNTKYIENCCSCTCDQYGEKNCIPISDCSDEDSDCSDGDSDSSDGDSDCSEELPKICTPGGTYWDGCNTCGCNEDGTGPTWCTERACILEETV